jgi:hypothetical protein
VAITTTPLDFKIPDGNELVRGGDNVIGHNAQRASDLLAATQAQLAAALNRLGQAEANIKGGLGTDIGLSEDPLNPGTYFMADTSPLTEDPTSPGLYTF